MKYAQILVLPETPPGGLTAGIDWGSADHAVCVVDTRRAGPCPVHRRP